MKKYNTPELTLCNFAPSDVITMSGLLGFIGFNPEKPDYEGNDFDV